MIRAVSVPRPNWAACLESAGVTFHSEDGPYWREESCYAFTATEIAELEQATMDLHQMCLTIVDDVIARDRFDLLRIPPACRPTIRASWEQQLPSVYGRFDLRYDGKSPPVLLEYNADTPTTLIEASVAQWYWLEATHPGMDQFNTVHEKLLARWEAIHQAFPGPLHFTGVFDSLEDAQTLTYLMDTAHQAGFDTTPIAIENIGWDLRTRSFVDQWQRPITRLFKLYPWEWLAADPFGPLLLQTFPLVIEPAWKMILNNKGLLAFLWERFPGHPNLLPAFLTPEPFGDTYVKKPLMSREGKNVEIVTSGSTTVSPGPYGREGWVYQAFAPLPDFDGWHPVIGSWVIGNAPAGIGIRETEGLVTDYTERFVPHYFDPRHSE